MTSVDQGLLEQMRDASSITGKCSVCEWLKNRNAADRATFEVAMADKSISTRVLHQEMSKREYPYSDSPVKTHRLRHGSA